MQIESLLSVEIIVFLQVIAFKKKLTKKMLGKYFPS
jgi:hypothetical protein